VCVVYACVYVGMYVCVSVASLYTYENIYYVFVCVGLSVHRRVFIAHAHRYIHTLTFILIHTHTHIRAHAHTHTHTHGSSSRHAYTHSQSPQKIPDVLQLVSQTSAPPVMYSMNRPINTRQRSRSDPGMGVCESV
jgi:hypothetical protein